MVVCGEMIYIENLLSRFRWYKRIKIQLTDIILLWFTVLIGGGRFMDDSGYTMKIESITVHIHITQNVAAPKWRALTIDWAPGIKSVKISFNFIGTYMSLDVWSRDLLSSFLFEADKKRWYSDEWKSVFSIFNTIFYSQLVSIVISIESIKDHFDFNQNSFPLQTFSNVNKTSWAIKLFCRFASISAN